MSREEILLLKRRIDELENGKQIRITQDRNEASAPPSGDAFDNGVENTSHTNAMMGLMEEEHHKSSENNFSDSSAIGFMNQIKRLINQHLSPAGQEPAPQPVRASPRPSLSRYPSKHQNLDYILPSRQRADHLLDSYWRLVHTLYPFLDTDEVARSYRQIWTGESLGEDGPTFVCLLNVIFSLTSILDPSIRPEERVGSANVFYQRARELLDFDLMQRQNILTTQCFLVLGQYLQSTNDPQQCWIFVGLAIRIAQSIGLDLPSTSANAQTPRQRDHLRKVWHGCVLMDRALSMTFGRPSMITSQAASAVPRPMAHQDFSECHCYTEAGQPDTTFSELHFFIESLKLYELMSETLLRLYNPADPEESGDDPYGIYFGTLGVMAAGTIFDMDRKYLLWTREVPTHLRWSPNITKSFIHQRQTNVLWLRYRHIRILLFRPVLSRFCSRTGEDCGSLDEAMPAKIALQCSIMCTRIALEVIDYFNSRIDASRQEELDDILPAWWYSILYVYTAGTVLVAARLHPLIVAEVTETAVAEGWLGVMKVMDRLQSFSKHAKRCSAALRVLYDQVPQQHQRLQRLQQGQNRIQTNVQNQCQQDVNVQQGDADSVDNGSSMHATKEFEPVLLDGNMRVEVLGGEGHANHTTVDSWNMSQDTSNMAFFDTSDLQLEAGDMSWLNSIPFDLYDT